MEESLFRTIDGSHDFDWHALCRDCWIFSITNFICILIVFEGILVINLCTDSISDLLTSFFIINIVIINQFLQKYSNLLCKITKWENFILTQLTLFHTSTNKLLKTDCALAIVSKNISQVWLISRRFFNTDVSLNPETETNSEICCTFFLIVLYVLYRCYHLESKQTGERLIVPEVLVVLKVQQPLVLRNQWDMIPHLFSVVPMELNSLLYICIYLLL